MTTNALRVVIADDEGIIRMGLKDMVKAAGHKVIATARNGLEAIEMVKQFDPDILLLDIKMPELDGLSVARRLTTEHPLPIVMLTAYSQKEFIDQATKTLVMDYLVKPVDEAKIAPCLELAVSRFHQFQAALEKRDALKDSLEDEQIIEDAKKQLMVENNWSEDKAYHHLQTQARKRQVKKVDHAKRILRKNT